MGSRHNISSYITVKVSHLFATNDVPKYFRKMDQYLDHPLVYFHEIDLGPGLNSSEVEMVNLSTILSLIVDIRSSIMRKFFVPVRPSKAPK